MGPCFNRGKKYGITLKIRWTIIRKRLIRLNSGGEDSNQPDSFMATVALVRRKKKPISECD